MKSFVVHPGILPHYQEDLAFIQQGLQEAIAAVASVFGPQVVLYGLQLSGSGYSAGAILWEGEVYTVAAFTPPSSISPDEALYLSRQTTYSPDGVRQYFDGQTRNAWEVRIATLQYSALPSAGMALASSFVSASDWVSQIAASQAAIQIAALVPPIARNEADAIANQLITDRVPYLAKLEVKRLDIASSVTSYLRNGWSQIGGTIESFRMMSGKLGHLVIAVTGAAATNNVIMELPQSMRPQQPVDKLVWTTDSSSAPLGRLLLFTDGTLSITTSVALSAADYVIIRLTYMVA